MTPDDPPLWFKSRATVIHEYPDAWVEAEVDQHRYDDCPCSPQMSQVLGCRAYLWRVEHRRIRVTEEQQ